MSNPIQIRIRGTEEVREKWKHAQAVFDVTYATLAIEMCKFVLDRRDEFERQLNSEDRTHPSTDRPEGN